MKSHSHCAHNAIETSEQPKWVNDLIFCHYFSISGKSTEDESSVSNDNKEVRVQFIFWGQEMQTLNKFTGIQGKRQFVQQ